MLLDRLAELGVIVHSVGKIFEVFLGRGILRKTKTKNNADGMAKTLEAMHATSEGLIFVNLVDFDQLYGHRNDVEGYAAALEAVDAWVPQLTGRPRAGRPGHLHRRPWLRPDHALDGPHPRVRAAVGVWPRSAKKR